MKKNHPTLRNSSQNSCPAKIFQNINTEAQFESPKHLHETTLETLKYPKQITLSNCLPQGKCKKYVFKKLLKISPFLAIFYKKIAPSIKK
jgi:hypothetical protein